MSEPSRPRPKRTSLKLTFALAVLGSGLVLAGAPKMAHATNLTVNTAEDIAPDANGKFPTDGKCSLRAAIRATESNSNAHDVDCPTGVPDADDVIVLDAALAGQTFRLTYAIDGNVQPFDTIISGGPLSIVGETENAADFVISGEGLVRPFTVGYFNIAAASLTLANLTVANGDGTANGAFVGGLDGFGGAIYLGDNGTTGSTLTLDNVVLKNNSAAYNGGAVYGTMLTINNNGGAYVGNSSTRGGAISVSSGPFTLNGYAVAFEGNRASDKGGAIYSNPGNEPMLVHLERSLLRDNAAVSAGGVVYVDSSRREKVFELHDSTATGNSSVFFAQANFQSFEILRSTFVDSGEIWRAGAGFIANSIVTGNSSCSYVGGPGIGGSRNLINAPGCGLGNIGDVTGLGPLAQNGGPKVQQTFGLQPGSNAIDSGDPAYCGVVDARSIARGVEGDGTVNAPQAGDCDIGSYEFVKAVVNFAQGAPVVNEGDGTTGIRVRLRLLDPDMQTLTSPLVVNVALGPGSTARIGPSLTHDDLDVPGNTVTFPAGSTDGATANLVVNLHQDFVAELNGETAVLQLTTVDTPGVSIAEPNTASVVIQDDDQAGIVMIETGGATRVSEATPTAPDSIGVRLQSQPDYEPGTTTPADVTMTVVPDRDCTIRRGGTVDAPSSNPIVTQIRNADWQTVITSVDVFAVDDPWDEDLRDEADPHPCELRFTFTSLDPVYARTHDAVEVEVTDDETARVVMTEIARPTFVEGRIDTAVWTVRLTTPPDPGKPLPTTPRDPTRVRFTPNEDCDVGAGPGVARDLTFTSADWNVAQQVQITVTQDPFVELLHECVVQPTVLGDDPVYADLSNPPVFSGTPPTIELDIQDYDPPNGITDDPPFVDITTSSLDVDEGAGTIDTISVVLRRAPVDAPVFVDVEAVLDPRIGDEQVWLRFGRDSFLRLTELTFTTANWDIPQTIDVRAFDDDFDEPATHTGALEVSTESTAPGFSDPNLARLVVDGVEIAGTATISADVADDDTSEIVITHTDGGTQVAEAGGSDTIAAVLATHPYADVTVTLTAGADCLVDGASSKSMVIPAEQWDTRHRPHAPHMVPFAVTAVDDEIVEADPHDCPIQVSGASNDTLYDALPDVTATVGVIDDDIPEIIVDTDGGIEVTEGGAVDTFTAVLGREPEANVVVDFSDAAGQATTDARTFTSSNWNVPQTYTVTAVDDDVDESTPNSDTLDMNIATTLAGYQTRAILTVDARTAAPGIDVQVADDDIAGMTLSTTTISLTEGDTGDTFNAVLDSEPVDDVALSFTGDTNCTAAPSGHTFDDTNWDQPVTVTVTATDDEIDQQDDDRVCSVAIATTSGDPSYDGISDTVTGPVADDDIAGMTLSTTTISLTEGDTGDTFNAVLDSEPVDDVALSFTANLNCTTGRSRHTFDDTNWDQPVTVTVTATDDEIDQQDDDRVCSVAIATTSGDPSYDGISDTVTGPVADDDIAGMTLSTTTISLTEGDTGDTFNAVLDSEPVDDVALSFTANINCTTGRSRHTFDDTNWDQPVTVTVTAADDEIDQQDDRVCSVAIATTSSDPSYDGIRETVTGPVADDDVSVCNGRLATLVGTASVDLLTGTPGPDVIVAVGGNDAIRGGGGDDTICGGAGDDVIRSGAGNDVIWGGAGNDAIRGGVDNDVISGRLGDDLLVGDAGGDTIRGGAGNDTVVGGTGADVLGGFAGDDVVRGERGDDRLRGGADDDRLDGAAGRDRCRGGTGADTATGCEIAADIP